MSSLPVVVAVICPFSICVMVEVPVPTSDSPRAATAITLAVDCENSLTLVRQKLKPENQQKSW